ncbi:hypothetical protein, partial [Listeria booriae]|uniref:hypothetical protein n=1 Tax=Listeria booriae TaxID=1552123 RepID=UPI001C8CB609
CVELEPQYTCEQSEHVIHAQHHVQRLRIKLQRPTPRKLHALRKKQERLFPTTAPVFVGAERAVSALQYLQISSLSWIINNK